MKLNKVLAGAVISIFALSTAACGGGGSAVQNEAIQCVDTAGNVWDDDYCEPDESEFNSAYYFVGMNTGNIYPPGEYDGHDSDHKKKPAKTTAKKAAPAPVPAAKATTANPTPTKAASKTTVAKPTQKTAPTTKKKK